MINIKIILSIMFMITLPTFIFGQLVDIDCDSVWINFQHDNEPTELITKYEKAPQLIGDYSQFNIHVPETHSEGKLYLQFVIDTLGNPKCIRILKTEDELLNPKAIQLIKKAKFSPAEQLGRKVASIMVLPVTFGAEPSGKKKKKCKP